MNLVRVKLECRHCRMTGLNAFGLCLAEGLYPVTQMQRSKRGRDLERALSRSVDRAAPRATGQRESLAALLDRRGGKRWRDQYQRDERSAQGKSQHCGPTFPSCRKGTNLESATTSIKRFALTGKV